MKLTIAILIVVLISFFVVKWLVPARINAISGSANIGANQKAAYRSITDESEWKNWWPGTIIGSKNECAFSYNGYAFSLSQKTVNGLTLTVKNRANFAGSLIMIPTGVDSTSLYWSLTPLPVKDLNGSFKEFEELKNLSSTFLSLIKILQKYLEREYNLYKLTIVKTTVVDTILVAKRMASKDTPTTEEIYNLVNSLIRFAKLNNIKPSDFPMLHVSKTARQTYNTMVALPVSQKPKSFSDVEFKRMIPGNILCAEVVGGPTTIARGYRELENYVLDHRKSSPAIPFESMVTDRSLEKDTAKWVTRIYYPIF